ncbi:unnamed protein product, partial [Prorocentrum cordatum]
DAFASKLGGLEGILTRQVSEDRVEIEKAFKECRAYVQDGISGNMFVSAASAVRDGIASLDIDARLEKLAGASEASDVETMRVEYMKRYINIARAGCKVGSLGVDIPDDFSAHGHLSDEMRAFSLFLKTAVREKWNVLEGPSFPVQIQDGQNMLTWAGQVVKQSGLHYADVLNKLADKLTGMIPDKQQVNDANMLRNAALQKLLFASPHRNALNPETQAASDTLQKIKKAQAGGYKIGKELKEAFKRANEARADMKVVIMLDWVLDHILHDKKDTAEGLKAQALAMRDMLTRTNVELPKYMTDLLDTMEGKAPAA